MAAQSARPRLASVVSWLASRAQHELCNLARHSTRPYTSHGDGIVESYAIGRYRRARHMWLRTDSAAPDRAVRQASRAEEKPLSSPPGLPFLCIPVCSSNSQA